MALSSLVLMAGRGKGAPPLHSTLSVSLLLVSPSSRGFKDLQLGEWKLSLQLNKVAASDLGGLFQAPKDTAGSSSIFTETEGSGDIGDDIVPELRVNARLKHRV